MNQEAFAAAVTYIMIYAVMTLGAFAVVIAMTQGIPRAPDLRLRRAEPARAGVIAVAMTVFMVSLAGIPPTGGFWAKFFVFKAAIERGGIGTALAVVMVVNSVISLYYYLAVPRQMLFAEPEHDRPLAVACARSRPSRWSRRRRWWRSGCGPSSSPTSRRCPPSSRPEPGLAGTGEPRVANVP